MNEPVTCGEKEALVAYLYDECDPIERQRIEAHLGVCDGCAWELQALQGVRGRLAEWEPPERVLGFRLVQHDRADEPRRAWWRLPVWAQAAAAVLVLGVAAGIANLDVQFGPSGVAIRTGWQRPAFPASAPPVTTSGRIDAGAAPLRAELTGLERRLREEFNVQPVSAASAMSPTVPAAQPTMSQDQFLAKVRALVADAEQRQQRELALRVAELQRDFDGQRRADLVRIQQGLGQLEGVTGAEVARQREVLNYLVRVSQQIK
jgi:anti-sigma factor RsiW